jgi:hypothetical protein
LAISSPSNGQVLKYNGTSWVNDSDAGITGSGSAGQVAYFTGATTQAGSNNLFWDNTNVRLGIGTTTPAGNLDVRGSSNPQIRVSDGTITTKMQSVTSLAAYIGTESNHQLRLITNNSPQITIFGGGNVHVGGTSDAGQRLQVTGDTLLKGSGNTSGTTALTVQNSASTNMWRFLNDGQLLLGSNASGAVIHPSGTDGILNIGGLNTTFYTSVITQAFGTGAFHFWGTTLQSTSGFNTHVSITRQFAPTSGTAQMYYLLVSPVINQTGGANGITRGLYVSPTLTAAADWRSVEWSNNTGWGLYGIGTANNYLAGATGIGTTTMTYLFNVVNTGATYVAGFRGGANTYIVVGDTSLAGEQGVNVRNSSGQGFIGLGGSVLGISATSGANTIALSIAGTERMRLDASGNLGLGVTPSAWGSTGYGTNTKAIEISQLGSSIGAGAGGLIITNNAYSTNSASIYARSSLPATQYVMNTSSGQHQWYNAPSGTAGGTITFTQAMTLDASGNLLLGMTTAPSDAAFAIKRTGSPAASIKFHNASTGDSGSDGLYVGLGGSDSLQAFIYQRENSQIIVGTNNIEAFRVHNTQNVHFGGTSSSSDTGERLQVTGTAKITGATTLGATTISTSSSTALAINSSASACYLGMSDSSGSFTYLGSDNGAMLFQTPASSYSTKMTLDSSGNLGLGVTPSAWAILKGLQVGLTASISGYAATTEGMFLMSNSFYNGGAFVYQVNGFATTYLQQNGEHRFQTAASGTAGNNITFTRPMTLTAAGRLLLGTIVEGTNLLDVVGTARITGNTSIGGNLTVDTNVLFVDAANNRVGIGTITPDTTFRVAGTANSTQAIFGSVDGRGLEISTSVISGTNEAGVILNARSSVTSGTFIFQTDGTQRVQIDSTGLIINGGNALEFINSAANAVSAIRPTGGGTSVMSTNSNGLHIAVGTEAAGDLILASNNTERIRLSSSGWFSHTNATNPSSSVTDSYVQYSADVTAGNAAPHFRTENGAVIKLYQETTAVGNSIISLGGGNSVLDDTTFDGYTLRQIVKALRNQGILA